MRNVVVATIEPNMLVVVASNPDTAYVVQNNQTIGFIEASKLMFEKKGPSLTEEQNTSIMKAYFGLRALLTSLHGE